jgi:probable phosphoglycerate mutase
LPPRGAPPRGALADNGRMTELIVIRHGETDWNRQLRFQGQIDVPLNDAGRRQAQRLAEHLAQRQDGAPIDVVVASDLRRARETAEALLARTEAALHVEPLWREQAFGILEGLDVPTIQQRHPELWARWVRHEADFALPEGESNAAFFARVQRALSAVVAAHTGRRVAIVTHGGVLDMLWRRVNSLPTCGPRECVIPNTGINRLRWRDEQLLIERWAEADHLDGLPAQPSTSQRRHAA